MDAIDINEGGYLVPAYNNTINKNTLNLNLSNVNLSVGQYTTLIPSLTVEEYTKQNIVWQSSNNDIVKVDTDGNVVAKANGDAVVKAYIPNTEYVAVCLVRVGNGGEGNTGSVIENQGESTSGDQGGTSGGTTNNSDNNNGGDNSNL